MPLQQLPARPPSRLRREIARDVGRIVASSPFNSRGTARRRQVTAAGSNCSDGSRTVVDRRTVLHRRRCGSAAVHADKVGPRPSPKQFLLG